MARGPLALVIGGSAGVWDDIAAALDIAEPDCVFACNDIGTRWPHQLDGWATLHPEHMPRWRAERERTASRPPLSTSGTRWRRASTGPSIIGSTV